jgi:hypothetical protein
MGIAGLLALAIQPVLALDSIRTGQWLLEASREPGTVQFSLTVRSDHGYSSHGRDVAISGFTGLTAGQIDGRPADVRFELKRDAGTFVCEGRVGDGKGAGLFELKLDPGFAAELERRGISTPSEAQQTHLAFEDVGLAVLDELKAQRYPTPHLDELVAMGDHGVDYRFVHGLAESGYRLGSVGALILTRDHGVDPRYVAELAQLGHHGLPIQELVDLRDHGVDPKYIREMMKLGLSRGSLEEMRRARDHGVDPRYVAGMESAGYRGMDLEELIRTRDHGVDPRYMSEMAAAGYGRLALADLVRARDHGVDARFAKKVNARLKEPATLDELIQIRDRGGWD